LRHAGLGAAQLLIEECARARPVLVSSTGMGGNCWISPSLVGNDGRLALLVLCLLEGRVPCRLEPRVKLTEQNVDQYDYLGWLPDDSPLRFFHGVPVVYCVGVSWAASLHYEDALVTYLQQLRHWPVVGPCERTAGKVLKQAMRYAMHRLASSPDGRRMMRNVPRLEADLRTMIAMELGLRPPPPTRPASRARR
jgi:hypothetical protein